LRSIRLPWTQGTTFSTRNAGISKPLFMSILKHSTKNLKAELKITFPAKKNIFLHPFSKVHVKLPFEYEQTRGVQI
jgi:hypothetical protein